MWTGLSQSFTAENPHVLFGFYVVNYSGKALSDTVLFSLYSGSGQFSALIAQAAAAVELAESKSKLLQVAFSSISLTPGEQYTVAVTMPSQGLPAAGKYSPLGVFIYGQDNAYSGGQFYYLGSSYPASEFTNWDLAFNVTPTAETTTMTCPAGSDGPGGTYNPTASYCLNGEIVPRGDSWCAPGSAGNGGPYDPNLQSCGNGSITKKPTPPGLSACPAGAYGLGGFYNPAAATCLDGVIVPAGYSFCTPGSYGEGGIYVPAQATCLDGVVVPDGDSYCVPGQEGAGGIYSATCTCSRGKITCNGASSRSTTSRDPGQRQAPAPQRRAL